MSRKSYRTDVSETNHTPHYRGASPPFTAAGAGASGLSNPTPGTSARSARATAASATRSRASTAATSPLVILDVVTSCGCTVARFLDANRSPPGDKTQITVTYDPANRPGTFTKELWVYSSDEAEESRHAHRAGQRHVPRQKSRRRALPGRCRRRACGWPRRSAPSPIFIRDGRCRRRSATPTPRTARSASNCGPQSASGLLRHRLSAANRAGRAGRNQPRLPHPGRQTPLRDRARRAGGR